MTEVVFSVSPAGIYGMNRLAEFLNVMKSSGEITDWSPRRAITESKGKRYVVYFAHGPDADRATSRWSSEITR